MPTVLGSELDMSMVPVAHILTQCVLGLSWDGTCRRSLMGPFPVCSSFLDGKKIESLVARASFLPSKSGASWVFNNSEGPEISSYAIGRVL